MVSVVRCHSATDVYTDEIRNEVKLVLVIVHVSYPESEEFSF